MFNDVFSNCYITEKEPSFVLLKLFIHENEIQNLRVTAAAINYIQ